MSTIATDDDKFYYKIIGVYGLCRDYIIGHMDVQNCVEVYKFARILCCRLIEKEAFEYIMQKFEKVVKTAAFLTLDKEEMVNVISCDKLWVSILYLKLYNLKYLKKISN